MKRRKKDFEIPKDDLCYEEPINEISFTDYVPQLENCIASFSFTDEEDLQT